MIDTISLYRSVNGGETFVSDTIALGSGTSVAHLGGLELVNDKWAMLNSGDDGCIYITTGTMHINTLDTTTSRYEPSSGNRFSLRKLSQDDGSLSYGDVNYHSLIAMPDINTIHVLFTVSSGNDGHLYIMHSNDGGTTWSEMKPIVGDTTATHAMLVAKGQNVYVVVGSNDFRPNRCVVYSHNGGDTWATNTSVWCSGVSDTAFSYGTYSYDIVIDPNDPTGLHAWYIGSGGVDIETTDGFQTISRSSSFKGANEYVDYRHENNFAPLLAVDNNGIRHLAMRAITRLNGNGDSPIGKFFYTFYRKETPEPTPSNTNMALHYQKSAGAYPDSRVVIPMTQNLYSDSAMSVGFWVRIDALLWPYRWYKDMKRIISLNIDRPETYSVQGWCIGVDTGAFCASINTDKTYKTLRTRALNSWNDDMNLTYINFGITWHSRGMVAKIITTPISIWTAFYSIPLLSLVLLNTAQTP